jgi:hypothetical protein
LGYHGLQLLPQIFRDDQAIVDMLYCSGRIKQESGWKCPNSPFLATFGDSSTP